MTTRQMVINEAKRIPEPLLKEVLDFMFFLEIKSKAKKRKIPETLILSESSFGKDWLCKEEDEAWKDL